MNPYNKLFEERIIFLGVQIDDASANDVMAQLLTLESIDPDRDITIYINSPGGSFTVDDGDLRHDAVRPARHPDLCIGQAASAAAVLLAAGTTGKRMALPNARILIHQPATEGGYGQSSDMEIQASEILRMRAADGDDPRRHTGQDEEQIRRDIERDKFLTAEEAKEYGLVDEVLTILKKRSERRRGSVVLDRARSGLVPPAAAAPGRMARIGTRGGTVDTARLEGRSRAPGSSSAGRPPRPCGGPSDERSNWVARIGDGGDLLKCSFCGKSQKQVKKLIAGPGVYICDECIDLCNEIIEEELAEPSELKWDSLPKPREIYEFLDALRDRPGQGQEGPVGRGLQPLQARPVRRATGRATRASSWPSPTSCCSARPAPARRCSPRPWPGCSTCRSPSPTRPP